MTINIEILLLSSDLEISFNIIQTNRVAICVRESTSGAWNGNLPPTGQDVRRIDLVDCTSERALHARLQAIRSIRCSFFGRSIAPGCAFMQCICNRGCGLRSCSFTTGELSCPRVCLCAGLKHFKTIKRSPSMVFPYFPGKG